MTNLPIAEANRNGIVVIRIVSTEVELAREIQTQLNAATSTQSSLESVEQFRASLSGDTSGCVVLPYRSEAELTSVRQIIQTSQLMGLPVRLIVLGVGEAGSTWNHEPLDSYVESFLHWPNDAPQLVEQLKRRGTTRTSPADNDIEAIIERSLTSAAPSLIPMVPQITLTALHDVTVLLTGETGTGKTFLARLIHDCSPRKKGPFVAVPCGAQPANLIESVFFGHEKGAFTGADRAKDGKFAAARTGTILLDEIDTLPWETQATLLRVIETGEFERIGSNFTHQSDARLIVTSNVDLQRAAEAGEFREDLYYRLNVMSFHLPPLRERPQDIAPLTRRLTARFNARFNKDLFEIHPETMAKLESCRWPGNIRQLENVIQQSVLMSSGQILLPEHLPSAIQQEGMATPREVMAPVNKLAQSRDATERALIRQALERNHHNKSRTAKELQISRVTLYKKMKKHGLDSMPAHPTSN